MHGRARRTRIHVTELTSHELSGWLKAAAPLNMYCAHAARGWQRGGARRDGAAHDAAQLGADEASQCGVAAGRDVHPGRGALRTNMDVTEPTSQELSGWLKAAAPANMLCAHATRGFGRTEARGAA